MRYLTYLVIICISVSCQRKNTDIDSHEILYSIDTVIIDSKGRLLDLNRFIVISGLDDEERSIFLYNEFDHSIDEVNLDDQEVVNNYSFEVEGPNGTGGNFHNLNLLKNGLFFIKSYDKSAVFDRNGRLLKKIDWVNSIDSNGLKYGEIPKNEILIGSNDLKAFGLSYDHKNRDVFLDVLSVQDNSVKRLDLDSKKSYRDLVLEVEDPQIFFDPYVSLNSENNLILISHQFSNEIILFNHEGEFVQSVDYDPKMTPKRVKDLNGVNITSYEQLQKEYQHFLEQVTFYPPVWDSVKNRYLRLSIIRIFSDNLEEGSLLPERQEVKVYLSVFDDEFNLIAEMAIPELAYEYGKYFTKDGKLWVYQNFSDELGFIVIDI